MTRSRTVATAIGRVAAADTISSTGTLSVAGVTMIDSAGALPDSADASAGDMVMTSDSNELFISDGSVWYSIALINTNPYFTDSGTPESTYALSTEESATTVTLIAVDSEGIPITYSAVADSDFSGLATISQDSSVFTITPLSEDSATTTSGTITFKASDGVNIATALSTFTLTFKIVYTNYTVLLAKASGNSGTNAGISDSSTSSQTVTVTGSPSLTSFSPYRHGGYSYYFDGSGDYIITGSDTTLAFGTSDFTVEAWIYITSLSAISTVMTSRAISSSSYLYWSLLIQTNGNLSFQTRNSGGTQYIAQFDAGITTNTWYHVAAVRESGVLTCYVNGIAGSTTSDDSSLNMTESYVSVGGFIYPGYTYIMNGYISDARVIKGTALYTADFTPPTSRLTAVSGTSLLTCHLPYLADGSSNDHTLTVNGNVTAKPFSPFDYKDYTASSDGGSFYVPGAAGNYLTLPAGTDFAMGTGDFTHEFWIYPTGYYVYYYGDAHGLVWSQDVNGTNWFGIGLGSPTSRNIYFNYGTSGGGSNVNSSGGYGSWIPNMWHHVAVVRNSGTLTVYLNGKGGTGVSVTQDFNNTTYVPTIGRYTHTDDNRSEGWISDYRVVKGTAIYTADFTPPTAPLSTPSGTVLHLKGQEGKVYDASQTASTLTLNGNAVSSTGQTKYASSSIYFDGASDYIEIPNDTTNTLTNQNWTVEAWIYPTNDYSTYRTIFAKRVSGSTTAEYEGYLATSTGYVSYYDGTTGYESTTVLTSNQWSHVAWVHTPGKINIYVNGTNVYSVNVTEASALSEPLVIGGARGYSEWFGGYIEDFRVTKGLVRYPFIPTKETLTAVSGTSLLTAHAATITDGSSNSHSISAHGNSAVSTFAPKQGMYSIEFDGNSSDLEITADSTLAATTNTSWTFEGWFYRTGALGPNGYTVTVGSGGSATRWGLNIGAANGVITTLFGTGSWAWPYIYSSPNNVISLNKWYHVAIVRDGSTSLKMFVDGGLVYSNTSANFGSGISGTFYLGSYYNNYNNDDAWYHGYMSNVRMIQGTALYTSSFTPPTAELKA